MNNPSDVPRKHRRLTQENRHLREQLYNDLNRILDKYHNLSTYERLFVLRQAAHKILESFMVEYGLGKRI